jgi:hypothetical protein
MPDQFDLSTTPEEKLVSTAPPPPDDPLQSMQKMDDAVQKNEADTPLDQPEIPCQQKIELTLCTEDGEPFANAPYSVTLADGTVKSGNLDEKGHAVIEHATLKQKDAKIRISSVINDDGTETLKIEVGASVEPNPKDEEQEPPPDVVQPTDLTVPWKPY